MFEDIAFIEETEAEAIGIVEEQRRAGLMWLEWWKQQQNNKITTPLVDGVGVSQLGSLDTGSEPDSGNSGAANLRMQSEGPSQGIESQEAYSTTPAW
jgi:hypothetical protein